MARLQEGSMRLNRQWSSLEELIGSALAASRRLLSGRKVGTQVPRELPLVQLDAVLVERLLANLLENVAKFTPAGSPVTIEAAVASEDGRRYLRVNVDDSGPGLPAGMESRIFDKFTRGERESAQPGIGLGLAISRAIVDAHGGKIGASNRTDSDEHLLGASFWFMLPADETPPAGPEALEAGGAGMFPDRSPNESGGTTNRV
jgi:two-component system, OmpR family, sensor histidine kinase KdpD